MVRKGKSSRRATQTAKKIREIARQLCISSRDVCHIKKNYEEEPNYVIEQGEDKNALQTLDLFEQGSHVTEPHKDQKCEPNTGAFYRDTTQCNIHEEPDNLKEENRALKDKNEELTNITLKLGEENQALKHKKIELDYKLKNKYIESRSGIIAVQTKSLYDDAYRLLDQDVEYCYLVYRNNQFD